MSGVRLAYLICDVCGDADRRGGEYPVETIQAPRATTNFIRRGKRDLCPDCATTPGPDVADDDTKETNDEV